MNIKKKTIAMICMLLAMILIISLYGVYFNKRLEEDRRTETYTQLSEVANQRALSVQMQIFEQISKMQAVADFCAEGEELGTPEQMQLLKSISKSEKIFRCVLVEPNGNFVTHNGETGNVAGEDFFVRAMDGDIYIGNPTHAILDQNQNVLRFSVPIIKGEQVIGVISSSYITDELNKLLLMSALGGDGYFMVCDEWGNIILSETKNTYFSGKQNVLDDLQEVDKDMRKQTLENLHAEKYGVTFLITAGTRENMYAAYAPLKINDWNIFFMVPQSVLDDKVQETQGEVLKYAAVSFVCVLALVLFVIITQINSRKRAWLNEQCFRALAEKTGKGIIEWNFAENHIDALSNFEEALGWHQTMTNFSDEREFAKVVHPEDLQDFGEHFDRMKAGETIKSVKCRIKDGFELYQWCLFSGVVINDKKGIPYKAIATIESIDTQEREREFLQHAASRDSLTELYNKTTTERLVVDILNNSCSYEQHAMISADVDNFKKINDSLGHLYGDDVLKEMGKVIVSMFRSSDVLGRFGGDEFVLFIRDIPNREFIQEKVEFLIRQFEKDCTINGVEHKVSISAGVSLFPFDGSNYCELYQKADEALYEAKRCGKDMYCFYGEEPRKAK